MGWGRLGRAGLEGFDSWRILGGRSVGSGGGESEGGKQIGILYVAHSGRILRFCPLRDDVSSDTQAGFESYSEGDG